MFGRSELNDMWKCVLEVIGIAAFAIAAFAIALGIWIIQFLACDSDIKCDYARTIQVDDSSKIEKAISNAVNDVKSRNFKRIKLDVETWHDREFKITCGGVDRGNLLKR